MLTTDRKRQQMIKNEQWKNKDTFYNDGANRGHLCPFMRPAVDMHYVCVQVEEGKLVRVQLELAQVKADIDRRIHEKEEEFEVTRSD